MTINEYIVASFANAINKGWHDEPRSFGEEIALIHSEVSEALEEFRNGHGYDEIYEGVDLSKKPEGIPIELADILIRVFDICGKYAIPLEEALRTKMAYNKTRPHRHGGKAL